MTGDSVKPLVHAQISVRRYGGTVEDFLPIHDFIDSSKASMPDMRHRAILHSSFGIYVAERVFGTYIVTSEGRRVSVRDVAEDHVIDDLGFIPTVERWLSGLAIQGWMSGTVKKRKRTIPHVTQLKVD